MPWLALHSVQTPTVVVSFQLSEGKRSETHNHVDSQKFKKGTDSFYLSMIDLQFSLPNLIFRGFFCTHDDLIRNKKNKSNQLDKVIFGGERYFRNTHFEQKVVFFF